MHGRLSANSFSSLLISNQHEALHFVACTTATPLHHSSMILSTRLDSIECAMHPRFASISSHLIKPRLCLCQHTASFSIRDAARDLQFCHSLEFHFVARHQLLFFHSLTIHFTFTSLATPQPETPCLVQPRHAMPCRPASSNLIQHTDVTRHVI